jgi:hypothetical protein
MFTGKALVFAVASLAAAQAQTGAPGPPLSSIKKICAERFSGDEFRASQARELAISNLFALNRFIITEDCAKADAILRGSVTEDKGQKSRSEGDSAGYHRSALSATAGVLAADSVGVGGSENLSSSETQWQASITLRLVNRDGDVIWAISQDSSGGKTKTALSDAVERGVHQLARVFEKIPER